MATFKEFRNNVKPNWCPGCGDFSIQAAIQRAAANVGLEPEELAVISGIGCSGRISGYINAYGLHGIHGRALPIAQGVKLANRELTVIASGGDGDGFAIGMGHTVPAIRRNLNMTYIVMDNQIYGLTKGQTSPRSAEGFKTKSTPEGSIESTLSPLEIAMSAGATFVAQSFSSDLKGLTSLIEQGIKHEGFSLINVFSPCVTFNKQNTFAWFKEHVYKLEDQKHDTSDFHAAMDRAQEWGAKIPIGLFYHNPNKKAPLDALDPALKDGPLVDKPDGLTPEQRRRLVEEFM